MPIPWVDDDNVALLTDLYELTMLQAYWREGMNDRAVFSLFTRKLPSERNFLVACGLDDALSYFESLHFTPESLSYLRSLPYFSSEFVDWLRSFRFTGSVRAVAEGTPVFADEPLVEVEAPLPEAQFAETFLMNAVHFQTVAASKAARVVAAAEGRTVVDFGLRRIHGADAGIKSARAFHIAGVAATSNVLAGRLYGIPIAGTMAHSYIQTHEDELEAFRKFSSLYPDTILLVDTYDTEEGVRNVIRLARELGDRFAVRGVRLDSGDLAALARASRRLLDEAGLERVTLFASGSLDEYKVARLVRDAPSIEGFGVGTRMGVASDAPALDMAYKVTAYAGKGRLKLSTDKHTLPGRKQIFRVEEKGEAVKDVLALDGESHPGRPLLHLVMDDGRRLSGQARDVDEIRQVAKREIGALPERLRSLETAEPPYPVEISRELERYTEEVARSIAPAADR